MPALRAVPAGRITPCMRMTTSGSAARRAPEMQECWPKPPCATCSSTMPSGAASSLEQAPGAGRRASLQLAHHPDRRPLARWPSTRAPQAAGDRTHGDQHARLTVLQPAPRRILRHRPFVVELGAAQAKITRRIRAHRPHHQADIGVERRHVGPQGRERQQYPIVLECMVCGPHRAVAIAAAVAHQPHAQRLRHTSLRICSKGRA